MITVAGAGGTTGAQVVLDTATGVGACLLAGLYLAFSVAVLPALRRGPSGVAVAVMRGVNRAILNPAFLTLFLGTAACAAVVVGTGLLAGQPWRVAGGIAVVAGFVVTAVVNVPLNTALDRDGDWAAFAPRWGRANHVRAAVSVLGVVALHL